MAGPETSTRTFTRAAKRGCRIQFIVPLKKRCGGKQDGTSINSALVLQASISSLAAFSLCNILSHRNMACFHDLGYRQRNLNLALS